MKIKIIVVGHLKSGPEETLLKEYLKRFQWSVEIIEVVAKKGLTQNALKEAEAQLILARLPPGTPLIALDERGQSPTSLEFSQITTSFQNQGISQVAFCIGGADGLHDSVRQRSVKQISFGKMTWPHMLVRVMLVEQLYRAQQILNNHPYHRE